MVKLTQIEAFVTVADLQSFRRAAGRLNTTQPNISARIAQLEQLLGVTLMERDAGSVRLTPKGQSLIDPARAILAAVDGFVSAAGDDSLFQGVLRLGVSELVTHTWLSAFLRDMKARFPNILVELTVDLSANLTKSLFDRDLDLTFQSGPFDRKARGARALGQSDYQWVAAPDLGLPGGRIDGPSLAAHPILTHARGSAPFLQLDAHFRDLGQAVRLVPSSNIGACLQMAQGGLGVACLPALMLTEALTTGRLVAVDYPWRPDPLRFEARHDLHPVPAYVLGAISIAERLFPPENQVS